MPWLSMLPQVEMALQEAEEQLNDGAASPNVVTDFSSRLIESLGKEMGWLGWGPWGHKMKLQEVVVLDHILLGLQGFL